MIVWCMCPIVGALPDLQISPLNMELEVYPGQEITLNYEYSLQESELGPVEIKTDVYRQKVILQKGQPHLIGTGFERYYEEEFSVTLGENVAKSISYVVPSDTAVGDDYYLDITMLSYMDNDHPSYADGWYVRDTQNERCLIHLTIMEESYIVIDDPEIDINFDDPGIMDFLKSTNFMVLVILAGAGLVLYRLAPRLLILNNPIVIALLVVSTIVIYLVMK